MRATVRSRTDITPSLPIDEETRSAFVKDLPRLVVKVGSRDRRLAERMGVKSVKLHPNYKVIEVSDIDIGRAEYDFVLLELDSPLQFSKKIKPA